MERRPVKQDAITITVSVVIVLLMFVGALLIIRSALNQKPGDKTTKENVASAPYVSPSVNSARFLDMKKAAKQNPDAAVPPRFRYATSTEITQINTLLKKYQNLLFVPNLEETGYPFAWIVSKTMYGSSQFAAVCISSNGKPSGLLAFSPFALGPRGWQRTGAVPGGDIDLFVACSKV